MGGQGRMNPGLGQRVSSTLQRDESDMHFFLDAQGTSNIGEYTTRGGWSFENHKVIQPTAKRIRHHNDQAIISSTFLPRASYQDNW